MTELCVDDLSYYSGGITLKCVAGTVGSGILGALAGGAAGSAVPIIGTGAGLIWGGIGGLLTGAATFC